MSPRLLTPVPVALLLALLAPMQAQEAAQEAAPAPAQTAPAPSPAAAPTAVPLRIVFQQGVAIPIDALELQGEELVTTREVSGTPAGTRIPLGDGIYVTGAKPAGTTNGLALLLENKPAEALAQLGPVLNSHLVTARTPGNFWVDTARIAAVAYSMNGDASGLQQVADILESTQGAADPMIAVAEELSKESIFTAEAKVERLLEKVNDANPTIVNALIYYFVGELRRSQLQAGAAGDTGAAPAEATEAAEAAEPEAAAEEPAGDASADAVATAAPDAAADPEATDEEEAAAAEAASAAEAKAEALSQTLEAYLTVPNAYPSGDLLINAAAEYQAAGLLLDDPDRLAEAQALLRSSMRGAAGSPLAELVKPRLDSVK